MKNSDTYTRDGALTAEAEALGATASRVSAFDPAPVVADVLHLLAHPKELRDEREKSHCGTCAGQTRILNPNSRRLVTCPACRGEGVR